MHRYFNRAVLIVSAEIHLNLDASFNTAKSSYDFLEAIHQSRSQFFEPAPTESLTPMLTLGKAKLAAFYLPQFHRLPVNDQAWGSGFTEWTNVTRVQPSFPGHIQPRLPGDLGFYDLENIDVMDRQTSLALAYGVSSFCFHYYWFAGQRIMEKPLDIFLKRKDKKMKFSVCWANENWTRNWSGGNGDVILHQPHSFESDKKIIYDLLPLFADERYIRMNGAALFMVYRPALMGEHIEKTIDYWRTVAQREGVGPLLILQSNFDMHKQDCIDAMVQFPPHGYCGAYVHPKADLLFDKKFSGVLVDYSDAVKIFTGALKTDPALIPGIFPSWDSSARHRSKASIFVNSTPEKYKNWLINAITHANQSKSYEGLVFINAWNEWAEGAYLEPCRWYGHAYLAATRQAIIETASL